MTIDSLERCLQIIDIAPTSMILHSEPYDHSKKDDEKKSQDPQEGFHESITPATPWLIIEQPWFGTLVAGALQAIHGIEKGLVLDA